MLDNKQLGELVHKAKGNDDEAFEILLNEFERFIYKEANRFVKSFPAEYGTDDLIQLGRIAIWEKLNKCNLDKNYSIRAFFCRCVSYELSNEWRKTKTKKRKHYYNSLRLDKVFAEDGENLGDLLPDDKTMLIDDYLISKEKIKLIKIAKQDLPKRQLKAIDLWSIGYKHKEIALIMNMNRNAIDALLGRAKSNIRCSIENVLN